jgi:hypothetical protein
MKGDSAEAQHLGYPGGHDPRKVEVADRSPTLLLEGSFTLHVFVAAM